MAGIYIHIPFCKQACHYCDFHFSTNQIQIDDMVAAIISEIESRQSYIDGDPIKTIYYGGGTPSLLEGQHIEKIQQKIYAQFEVVDAVEITFECNPDDLTEAYLRMLKERGINRLSIGVQSFDEAELAKLNRAHSATEAVFCIETAKKIGFDNITIDLIYGLPDTTITYWEAQIEKVIELGVNHISAYCLTFEEETAFGNWLKKGKIKPLTDEKSLDQFKLLVSVLKENGFEHYEISNFAKNDFISKHNSAYWLGQKYLGVGPSAHSYNGLSRQWNIANNPQYIKKINEAVLTYEVEELTTKDQFNEYILTRLRTKWGIEKEALEKKSVKMYQSTIPMLQKFIQSEHISQTDTHFYITEKGKFIADHITSELFVI